MRRISVSITLCAAFIMASSAGAVVHHIFIFDNYYSPYAIEVRPGDTVVWTLQEGTHSSTSDVTSSKTWDSGPMSTPGETFQVQFLTPNGPGPFPYHCEYHPDDMKDTIFTADTCGASMDANGDGLVLTIADIVYFVRVLSRDAPMVEPYYQADINGDCVLDGGDVDKFNAFLIYGMSVFPIYPVPTCCYPDTVVGSCCFGDSCSMRSEANCGALGGEFLGTGTVCLPDNPCVCCRGIRGNVDGDANDVINIADLTFVIQFLFFQGPSPACPEEGDVNGDGAGPSIVDLTYLVAYLFGGGPAPPACP